MSEAILFPSVPNDGHTRLLLNSMDSIAIRILNDSPSENHLFQCAAYLRFIGTAPYVEDEAYFKVHEGLREMCRRLSDHYNHYIHSQGNEYKLKILNAEIGPFNKYFNDFQLAMYYLDLKAKQDPNLSPLGDLVWGFYCSLYSRKKCEAFLELFFNILKNLNPSR